MDTFVCNVCFQPLVNYRFKCVCCIDYDVCEEVSSVRKICTHLQALSRTILQCLSQPGAEHLDHVFVKISLMSSSCVLESNEIQLADELAVLDNIPALYQGEYSYFNTSKDRFPTR